MQELLLLAIDSEINFGEHNATKGIISMIIIGKKNVVQYEITYWLDGERDKIWMYEDEILQQPDKQTVNIKVTLN